MRKSRTFVLAAFGLWLLPAASSAHAIASPIPAQLMEWILRALGVAFLLVLAAVTVWVLGAVFLFFAGGVALVRKYGGLESGPLRNQGSHWKAGEGLETTSVIGSSGEVSPEREDEEVPPASAPQPAWVGLAILAVLVSMSLFLIALPVLF